MEWNGNGGLLEEILALTSDQSSWELPNIPLGINHDFFCNNGFDNSLFTPQAEDFSSALFDHRIQTLNSCEFYHPFGDEMSSISPAAAHPELTDHSSTNYKLETPSFLSPDESLSLMEDELNAAHFVMGNQNVVQGPCKMEEPQLPTLDMVGSVCMDLEEKKGGRMKKLDGQPSKNLMAERRRRKRLNDRLSMLRSVVPKISKMDRTSILGDTIDYMKELLDRINTMQEELEVGSNSNQLNLMNIFKNVKPNEILVRNSPKFDVERRNVDTTRIEICCGGKPGLLLSTVTTLEALGLEIQHCVISCFNDFSMQASCSQGEQQRGIAISGEEIKQELFRNAGYGGRCL